MKKILTLALALIMMLSLAVCVSAAGDTVLEADTGSHSGDINVGVVGVTDVYYVTVAWDSLEFKYSGATWDPKQHKYVGDNAAWTNGQDKAEATITVVNRSNVGIDATATLNNGGVEKYGVKAVITSASCHIESAENVATTALDTVTDYLTLTVEGTPKVTDNFVVDTVTITIVKNDMEAAFH